MLYTTSFPFMPAGTLTADDRQFAFSSLHQLPSRIPNLLLARSRTIDTLLRESCRGRAQEAVPSLQGPASRSPDSMSEMLSDIRPQIAPFSAPGFYGAPRKGFRRVHGLISVNDGFSFGGVGDEGISRCVSRRDGSGNPLGSSRVASLPEFNFNSVEG